MHEDQVVLTTEVVRQLVADQFPQWSSLAITPIQPEGTVNAIFRIGDRLVARFPLRPRGVDATRERLISEADAARQLLKSTSVAVPRPVVIGEPGAGFPMAWSVQTWLPGIAASRDDHSRSALLAHDLAGFIHQVRAMDPGGRTFDGDGRGGELQSHDEWMKVCFQRSEGRIDVRQLRRIWARLRLLPRESPDVMTHGDLIPGNVLVRDGRLAGILDVGGLGPADPALDLVGAWHLFDAAARAALREDLQCDDVEWERGKAWAFEQAVGAVWYYAHSNPPMSCMGVRTLERIVADEPG